METIFDGIQRPLKTIAERSNQSAFVPRGVDVPCLDQDKLWAWQPGMLKVGDIVEGGSKVGHCFENDLVKEHMIMTSPKISGRLVEIMPAADMTVSQTVAVLEDTITGKQHDISMSHFWPVRNPRPVREKLPGNNPLLTGQRVLDALFPTVQGGTCAIPGAFGCGKTCISQALSKYSNSDCIIYVGCGERGNEMAEVLDDFPKLKTRIND